MAEYCVKSGRIPPKLEWLAAMRICTNIYYLHTLAAGMTRFILMAIKQDISYPSSAKFQYDVDIVIILEEALETNDVFVAQAAMNFNLLFHLINRVRTIKECSLFSQSRSGT